MTTELLKEARLGSVQVSISLVRRVTSFHLFLGKNRTTEHISSLGRYTFCAGFALALGPALVPVEIGLSDPYNATS